MPAVIRSALVSAHGKSGYAGCQTLARAPPNVKMPCDPIWYQLTQW